jgi:hypothetical protein
MPRDRETRIYNSESERFERTLKVKGMPGRAQRQSCHVHSQVFIAGALGRVLCSVSMISTDGLSWKDAYDQEHLVTDILVLPDAHPWCRLDVAW